MELVVVCALIGLIPAAIAHSKGHSFGLWWVFGALLFIVALPMSIVTKPDTAALERRRMGAEGMKKCPACAELVKADAQICRFCRTTLTHSEPNTGFGIQMDE